MSVKLEDIVWQFKDLKGPTWPEPEAARLLPLPLPPAPPVEVRDPVYERRNRQRDEEALKMKATARLWKSAADTMTFRYVDLSVTPQCQVVAMRTAVRISFVLPEVRNTAAPEARLKSLTHYTTVRSWPGTDIAQKYLAVMWASLCMHEGLEMATFKEKRVCHIHEKQPADPGTFCRLCVALNAPVDAHEDGGFHQTMLTGTADNVVPLLTWALGPGIMRLIDSASWEAENELANEIDYLREGVNYD